MATFNKGHDTYPQITITPNCIPFALQYSLVGGKWGGCLLMIIITIMYNNNPNGTVLIFQSCTNSQRLTKPKLFDCIVQHREFLERMSKLVYFHVNYALRNNCSTFSIRNNIFREIITVTPILSPYGKRLCLNS